MERVLGYRAAFNANLRRSSGTMKKMCFDAFLPALRRHLPISVQFGGFRQGLSTFLSFGKEPYVRSFQVHWATKKVTIIGWPFRVSDGSRAYSDRALLSLRSELETTCAIQHKYPGPKYEDNDLFMVIGELMDLNRLTDTELREIQASIIPAVEKTVRDMLSTRLPVNVTLSDEHVFVCCYDSETLPLETTDAYCIADETVDPAFLRSLYA
jgi:hypothetical protein